MLTRQQAVDLLKNHPVRFAKMLGFDKLTSLHEEWIKNMVYGKGDVSLMSHRASYKTTCVSFALSIIIILLPNLRTLFLRKTDTDVKEIIKQVQKILLDPHTQYIVFSIYGVNIKLNVSSATELTTNLTTDVKGTNQLVGIGIGSSLTGKHFDRIFTDDIINIIDRISKAERERTKLIYQELQNIKNRNGRIFNTLTPWHPESAESLMPNIQRYDCYETKLITPEELEEIKEKMIPSLFACNYELKHIASDDIIFLYPNVGADPALVEQGVMHIDAAFYGEDSTAWGIMTKHGGKYYLYGKIKRQHVSACYDLIQKDYDRFMCKKIYIEDNADKGFVAKELRQIGMRTSSYTESMNKHLKITTFLVKIWKDVIFVDGTDNEYIDQICDYNENADHDDAPDNASCLARLLHKKTEEEYRSPFGGVYS